MSSEFGLSYEPHGLPNGYRSSIKVNPPVGIEGHDIGMHEDFLGRVVEIMNNAANSFLSSYKGEYEILRDEREVEAHMDRFSSFVADNIIERASQGKKTLLAISAIGGYAPGYEILGKIPEDIRSGDNFSSLGFDKTSPDDEVFKGIVKNKAPEDMLIIVDDGMTTGVSNLERFTQCIKEEDREEFSLLLSSIKALAKEKDSCNDPLLSEYYASLLGMMKESNIVMLPLYSRNYIFNDEVGFFTASDVEEDWNRMQSAICDEEMVVIIPENQECVGSATSTTPCRDLGVDLVLLKEYGLRDEIYCILVDARVSELRYLAGYRGLYQMKPEGIISSILVLIDTLNNQLDNLPMIPITS